MTTLQWLYFTLPRTHRQFDCVNMAPGSTEAIHYAARALVPAEATHILLDYISPPVLHSTDSSLSGTGMSHYSTLAEVTAVMFKT